MNDKYNKTDIEIIIHFLTLLKTNKDSPKDYIIAHAGTKYLLAQTLRQIKIPKDKFYISYNADELWNKIRKETNDSIFNYYWQMRVTHDNNTPVNVLTYKGGSNASTKRTLLKHDGFNFRQVFHDDHIIPVNLIVNQLIALEDPTYDAVMYIIENMSLCRMLKSEDRKVKERSKRPFSQKMVIENIYFKYGIFVKNYHYQPIDEINDKYLNKSIQLPIPKTLIKKTMSHPEAYGDEVVELDNGMVTDIYKDDLDAVYSITNDVKLINYVMKQQGMFISL